MDTFRLSSLAGLLVLFIVWAIRCAPTDKRERFAFRCVTLTACALYVCGVAATLIQSAH